MKFKKSISLENLIYLTIIALPAYLLRFTIYSIPTNILEILILLVIIFWLIKAFIVETPGSSISAEMPDKKYIFGICLIFIGFLLSTLTNKNYAAGFGIIKSWFILPIIFAYVAINTAKNKERIFYALYLSAFLVTIVAIFYKISGVVTYDGRLEAFFNSPNYLAMYLAPGIITGMMMLSQNQKSKIKNQNENLKFKNTLVLVSLLIIIISIYFTYSYAAWIAIIISLAAIQIIKNKSTNRKLYWLLGAIIILVLILFSQVYSEKLNNILFSDRSSLESRLMIWRSAGKILSDNWLLGIGPGDFQTKYLEYQKYFPPYLEWAVPHPHNLYLAFWLYGGLLGIAGFLGLVYFWLKKIFPKPDSIIKFISLGIILYFLIHGLLDTTYFKNDLALIFWLTFLVEL